MQDDSRMNVFILDEDPTLAAQMQCDKHVVKMLLETAQMLSTVHAHYGSATERMYKPTHVNHPCNVWLRKSLWSYRWLLEHFEALCDEYTWRYRRVHKSAALLDDFKILPDYTYYAPVDFALAMPDEFKQSDPVASYRAYYRSKKDTIDMRWKAREVPDWL